MTIQFKHLALAAATTLVLSAVACGDDEATTTSAATNPTTGSGGISAGGNSAGGNSAGGNNAGGGVHECTEKCSDLLNCGYEDDGTGTQICPGFPPNDDDFAAAFVQGCIENPACKLTPVNTDDCAGTVATIKTISGDFKTNCEDGPSGAGGGGGNGGNGGAGGN